MADAAKVDELMADETVQAVAAMEPVAIDAKALVTEALEKCGNDLPSAREYIAKEAANTDRKA